MDFVLRGDVREQIGPFGMASFERSPIEFRFQFRFFAQGIQLQQSFVLADPFFPGIGYRALLVRISNFHGRRLRSCCVDHLQRGVPHGNAHGVESVHHVVNGVARQVLFCCPRKSKHHHEIPVFHPANIDWKMMRRLVRDIALIVIRWIVIGVGIDAEHAKIPRVTRPHPVVCVAAKFPHR